MGRRYFCEYCGKSMAKDYDTRKKHRASVNHKMLVKLHFTHYRDYKTLVKEESGKTVCLKSLRNECPFGEKCYNSHFTKEQLDTIFYKGQNAEREALEKRKLDILNADLSDWLKSVSTIPDCFENHLAKRFPTYDCNLPPSLRPTSVDQVKGLELCDWG